MSDRVDSGEGAPADLTRFNFVAAALIIAVSLVALLYLIPVHVPLRQGMDQGLSARFMPRLAAWATLILAGLLLLELVLRRLRGSGPLAEDNEDNELQQFGHREASNALLLAAGSGLYIALLFYVGFHIATALALFACFWAGRFRNPIWLAILAIGFPYALQQALWHGLYVIVPQGYLF